MALYPQARRAVAEAARSKPVWAADFDIAAARAEARALALAEEREEVAEVVDLDADGVPCRLYRPRLEGADTGSPGIVVHLHGGGFVFHDLEVHDAAARRLANRSGLAVLSVDYRLAPEHPFPAAVEDVDIVLAHLRARTDEWARGATFLHGDSAGGNLALVAALRNPGRVRALALVYPFLDPELGFPSYDTSADGFRPREAAWYWEQYAASPADLEHPDLAPLRSDRLAELPPTLVVTAEQDPLRDEGEALALALAERDVEVVATRYLGQVHGFWRHVDAFHAAEPLTRQVAGFLRLHA
ncbi:alpha/beta hydrolase [Nocardioides sp.]|uniref:alpha/beta hydrolase n=1 Tax=Nocardioides sp. TaxID=35761 RepID=UPI0035621359